MLRAKLSKLSMPTKSHFSCYSLLTKTKKKEFAPVAKPTKSKQQNAAEKIKNLKKPVTRIFPGNLRLRLQLDIIKTRSQFTILLVRFPTNLVTTPRGSEATGQDASV